MAKDTGTEKTDVSDDDRGARWMIVAFVVCILLGLGVLGWHYHFSDKTAPMCASAEAHCGDKTDPSVQ